MNAFFGILALVALSGGFLIFGWIVHASLNHRVSVFGLSFDKEEASRPFHRALFAMGVVGLLAFFGAWESFVAAIDKVPS